MDIRFECPNCNQHIAIDEAGAGAQIDCPNCRAQLTVPEPSRASPSPQPRPRIRLGTSQPAPAPPVVPAPVAPATVVAASGDQYHCNNPDCGTISFESQLLTLEFGGKSMKVCPKCRLGVSKLTKEKTFWSRLPGAFAYPLRGNGIWIVITGTPLLLLYDFVGFGILFIVAKLIFLGLIGAMLINVIQTTADDEDTALDWPDVTDKFDLITTGLKIIGSVVLVFAPAICCSVMLFRDMGMGPAVAGHPHFSAWALAAIGCGILGLVYYPMSFLAFAMVDSLNGLNPVIVIPAIVKLPLQYLAILILIGGLILIRGILNLLCGGLPFLWRLACYVPLEFLAFYSLIVSARLLGLLYKSNSARLGWFE